VKTESADIKTKSSKYYKELDQFLLRCEELVAKGQAYLAVILCHELYRFLYPVEPYAKFMNDNPVPFVTKKIVSLNKLALQGGHDIFPYPVDLDKAGKVAEHRGLEKETSDLYSDLWTSLDQEALWKESLALLRKRLPKSFVDESIVGKSVVDLGCGSGRYTMALARVGAKKVVGLDVQARAYRESEILCKTHKLSVEFIEGTFLTLPFEDGSFDTAFSNGTFHHSESIEKSLREMARILKEGGRAFLYLYASGGIFWNTRIAMRELFKKIPREYTQRVPHLIGMPGNRFIFCDTWYVPVETLTTRSGLEAMLNRIGFQYEKIISGNEFDLDKAIADGIPQAEEMWGDGEHRYLLTKKS